MGRGGGVRGHGKTGVQHIRVISICGKCSEGRVQDALPEEAVFRLSSGESGAWEAGGEGCGGSACEGP